MKAPLIYLVAGEASGDALGSGFMRALKTLQPDARFSGIGGEAMQREGLQSFFPYSELSLMGFMEVVPHIPAMLRRIRETAQDIAQKQPSVVVTIDSPGFTFRLAKALKENPLTASIKRIHYVAPSVWAYKPGRAAKTALLFDTLLTLLPFEPPYFEKEGLKSVFAGHPVLWNKQKGDAEAFRKRHGIAADARLMLVLPGSRRGEIKYHLDLFLDAAKTLQGFTPVILAGPQVKETILQQAPNTLVVDIGEKNDAFAAAELALTKSGTISLELAAAGVPMVVAHRGNPLSAWLVKRMILIDYVSLANIALNRPIIPELLQEHCNLAEITAALTKLSTPEARNAQLGQYAEALAALRGNNAEDPSMIAARTVLGLIADRKL
jgi:lipid-A-disaccharide synthase